MIRNNQCLVYSKVYHNNNRHNENFHQPFVNMTKYQKGMYYLGVRVFNKLPTYIKIQSDNPYKFKLILQKILYENSFHSLDEYFELQTSEI